ncbi:NAD-dependent epimerase/dehydratase family protein [Candidatus Fermentibacteria bacterium]|nr:NAD-dependent epimerase/dehydratase family protein [Candidatus Fermentibacteria bacterium]
MATDLVTGASGFIGSHVVDHLLSRGRSVRVLLRPASSLQWLPADHIEVIRLAAWGIDSLTSALAGIDRVYHVAGTTHAANRAAFFAFHVDGTKSLLEACRRGGTVGRVIVFSSLAAAGPSPTGRPLHETDPPGPVSWYGQSKLAQEEVALSYADTLSIVILRPPAVYGPRDRDFLPLFQVARRGLLPAPAHGTQSFTHVGDVVAGAWAAGQGVVPSGGVYFISSREVITWQGLAQVLGKELGRTIRVIPVPRMALSAIGWASRALERLTGTSIPLDRNKIMEARFPHWVCWPSKAERELGFCPALDLSEGIARTIGWYRERGAL